MGRLRRLGLLVAAVPVLAGCMTLSGHIEVHGNDTVSYEFHAEVTEAYLRENVGGDGQGRPYDTDGGVCDALWPNDEVLAGENTLVPTEREGWRGCRVAGSAERADFGRTSIGRTGMIVVGNKDEYRFVWAPTDAPEAASQMEDFELSVTFPGPVTGHSGSSTVWLNTVTWRDPADLVARPGLVATGKIEPGLVQRLIGPVVLAVGLAAVICIAGAVMRRRPIALDDSSEAPATQPDGRPAAQPPSGLPTGVVAPTSVAEAPQTWAPEPADLTASESMGAASPSCEDQPTPVPSTVPTANPWRSPARQGSPTLDPSPWAPPD